MGRIVNISGTEIKDHGIQVLAHYIRKNLPDDYTLVLGCKPYTFDVDGVLIGKGSIFAIEVKDWKGNIRVRSYGLWEKDRKPIENPLAQARNNTVALAKWLRSRIGQDRLSKVLGSPRKLWVRSLLVFTNPKCSIDATGLDRTSNTGVSIMSLDRVKDFVIQQEGNEQIGQMVKETFDRLDADIRSLARMKNRKGGIAVLVFTSVSALICGAYLTFSNSPDKSITLIPLGILMFFVIVAIIGIIRPANTIGVYHEYRRYGLSYPNEFRLEDYGEANAVLTNQTIDHILSMN